MTMKGPQMKAIRQKLGLTAKELARALGFSGKETSLETIVFRFESGGRPIPKRLEHIMLMFEAYGVPEMFYKKRR